MVSVVHWNIFAKGDTPTQCLPSPNAPNAWSSIMLNMEHTQESFRCWKKQHGQGIHSGTDIPNGVPRLHLNHLCPMRLFNTRLFVKVLSVSFTTMWAWLQKKNTAMSNVLGCLRQIAYCLHFCCLSSNRNNISWSWSGEWKWELPAWPGTPSFGTFFQIEKGLPHSS